MDHLKVSLHLLIFILILAVISAIIGLFSRILKFIFKKSYYIDKVLFIILAIISTTIIVIKGYHFFIEVRDIFFFENKITLKILYFIIIQLFFSFFTSFFVNYSKDLVKIFFIFGKIYLSIDEITTILGIPLFFLNLYHYIPIIGVIATIIM